MAITKRPPEADAKKVEAFISGAPDAKTPAAASVAASRPVEASAAKVSPQASSRKHAISLTISPVLLARMDEAAAARGLSRAAAIADACADWLKSKEGA
jgi:hypothetical protein